MTKRTTRLPKQRRRCSCGAPAVAIVDGVPLCREQLDAWRELLARLGPDGAARELGLDRARRAA